MTEALTNLSQSGVHPTPQPHLRTTPLAYANVSTIFIMIQLSESRRPFQLYSRIIRDYSNDSIGRQIS